MRISREYKIWEATAKDDSRPILQEVLIDRISDTKGVAIACDGVIMAVVPVELEEGDVCGPVKASIIQDAIKNAPKSWGDAQIDLAESECKYLGKAGVVTAVRSCGGTYPDYKRIMPERRYCKEQRTGKPFSFDPKLLGRLVAALAVSYPKMTVGKNAKPIIVEVHPKDNGELCAPYGLLMPCYIGR